MLKKNNNNNDNDALDHVSSSHLHDLVPDHLKCSICYDVYADPHFAGCGVHAFCKGCLDSLAASLVTTTTTTMEANANVLSISCPHCRRGNS